MLFAPSTGSARKRIVVCVLPADHENYLENKQLGNPKMSAAWESLHRATHELASCEPLKQRLILAYSKHLKELDPQVLPPEHRLRFESLAARLTSVRPLRGETAVAATVRKMSNHEASDCAHQLIDLMAELAGQLAETIPSRARKVVALYSAEG